MQGYDKNNNPIKEKVAVIKEYDNFTTNLYQKTHTSTGWLVSAIENIIVSPDWFSEDEGAVSFFVEMNVTFPEDYLRRRDFSGIYFSYVKENDTIHLSSPYDFNDNILQ